MKKRLILVIMTVIMLWLLPGGVAMAVVFGFDVEDTQEDNMLTEQNGAYVLQIRSTGMEDYVTNYGTTADMLGLGGQVNPDLINGNIVAIYSRNNLSPDGTITVDLQGKAFTLNSFVCANKDMDMNNLIITTGSITDTFPLAGGTNTTITPSAAFRGITSFNISWTNGNEGYFDKFNITPVLPPTDIALSNASIAENTASGTKVGDLSSTDTDSSSFTYSLVSGIGSTDNASFSISGNELRLNMVPDYEYKSSYSIRIQTQDETGLTYSGPFTVTITDVNEAPTDISLSNASVPENSATGTIIGTLIGIDPDAGDSFSYSLPAGVLDNAMFSLIGNTLKLNVSVDYETKNSFNVRIRCTDSYGLYLEKVFTIAATNVNEAPTDIALSNNTITENSAIGTTVGSFTAVDPDGGSTFTYSLVSGTGDVDNANFSISLADLRTAFVLDYETKSSYSIRVRVSDGSLTYEKQFTITVLDGNDPPTDITLTVSSIAENGEPVARVGTLVTSDNDGDTHTYTLVAGAGDNGRFTIYADDLYLNGAADYETKESFSVRIRSTDNYGLYLEKVLTVTVINVNEAPTNITLSNYTVAENSAIGTVVGTLIGTDPDADSTFTYALVAGAWDTDNASFTISGNELKLAVVPDYETKTSYSIRMSVSDGALSFAKAFTITVMDGNDAPTDIALSSCSIAENTVSGTALAIISSIDPDGLSHTYTLVSGAGSTDNVSFTISGNELRLAIAPDYEGKSSYNVRIRSTDNGGMSVEKAFVISVTDVNEAPTGLALSKSSISESSASGTTVGALTGTDQDAGSSFTYSLVSGAGDTDNTAFSITGNALKSAITFHYQTKSSYSIRIRVTDAGGLYYEKIFTITIERVDSTPSSPQIQTPSVEKLTLNITNGVTENRVAQIEVERTTTSDGVIKDSITFEKQKATETIEMLSDDKSGSIRLVAPETKDKAAEVKVNIPAGTLDVISNTELDLELETENVRVSIPNTSLGVARDEMEEDLYFRLAPVTEEDEKQELTERASKNGMLVQLLGEDISVIGSPMVIETNMPQTTVDILLPLTDMVIPKDDKEREELLSKLAVYVEHSDGDKEVIRGELVLYREGVYGIKFSISKFSTFTIIRDERVKSNQCEILSVITPANTPVEGALLKAKVKYKSTSASIKISVSKGATWKLYSDKACTKVVKGKVKLKGVLTKAYVKVVAEDGVSYSISTIYIIRSKNVK